MTYHYSASPTDDQLEKAADLVDAGGQLATKLDRKKFRRSSVIVVALDENEVVVGAAAVKERKAESAEIGYLIVHPDHRKRGIAQELTQHRIAAAKEKGLALLFANIRRDNIPSIANLQKAKFEHWGDFVSAHGTKRIISWHYLPLTLGRDCSVAMQGLTHGLKPAPRNRKESPKKDTAR